MMKTMRVGGIWLLLMLMTGAWTPSVISQPRISHISPLRLLAGPQLESFLMLHRAVMSSTQQQSVALATHVRAQVERVSTTAPSRLFWFENVDDYADLQNKARRFGVTLQYIEELNPGVELASVGAGTRILFYRFDPSEPPRSVGSANRGYLIGGMPMPEGEHWVVRNIRQAWGTPRTIRSLVAGFHEVGENYPGGSRPMVGDISLPEGGPLRPHKSHRSGRDVDVAYYSLSDLTPRFWDARSPDLDVERNWAIFRYWIENELVEYIFVDTSIQRALADYAYSIGEEPAFIRRALQTEGGPRAIIRHERGHANHFHARFHCSEWDSSCR